MSLKAYPRALYDGHLLKPAKKSGEENSSAPIKRILIDLGVKKHGVDDEEVLISRTKKLFPYQKKFLKRRQAIEPWIGHNFRIIRRKLRIIYALYSY
ncbi:MAG: hypothetical protein QRY71_06010 [Candidatus Rhabdochlamydia sp.]